MGLYVYGVIGYRLIYQHVNTSIHESMNTYRTDEQEEIKTTNKTKPDTTRRTDSTRTDGTKPRHSNPDRTKPAAQGDTERHSKASNKSQSGTKQHERNKRAQKFGTKPSRTSHKRQHKHSPKVHSIRDGGFYCSGMVEHGWKFRGVWGIVRRDRVIYVYVYIYIYMYIYTIAGDFSENLTRTCPHTTQNLQLAVCNLTPQLA